MAQRCAELLTPRESELAQADALHALADLDVEELAVQIDRALQGPVCASTSAAIEIIGRRNDPSWCPAVYRLTKRLTPTGRRLLLMYGCSASSFCWFTHTVLTRCGPCCARPVAQASGRRCFWEWSTPPTRRWRDFGLACDRRFP